MLPGVKRIHRAVRTPENFFKGGRVADDGNHGSSGVGGDFGGVKKRVWRQQRRLRPRAQACDSKQ